MSPFLLPHCSPLAEINGVVLLSAAPSEILAAFEGGTELQIKLAPVTQVSQFRFRFGVPLTAAHFAPIFFPPCERCSFLVRGCTCEQNGVASIVVVVREPKVIVRFSI